jgi:hypothetical protein
MEKDQSKSGKIIHSGMIHVWTSILLPVILTSAINPLVMIGISTTGASRERELAFVAFAILVTMTILMVLTWVKYWEMTKYIFKPLASIQLAGEDSGMITPEIGNMAADVIKCLAINWILMIISIAAIIGMNLLVREYFLL